MGKSNYKLIGKSVLITGGAQRVGKHLCLAFAKSGANIIMNYWRTEDDAKRTKYEIEKLGRKCLKIEADITNINHINKMMAKIENVYGRLDILVHNASNFNQCPFIEVTEEIWNSSFNVNLKGPFFLSQAAAKLMLKNGSGRIIALVGNSYYENWPTFIPHVVSKTALAKLMQSLAIALSPKIQCNAICPAFIYSSEQNQTEYISNDRNEKFLEDFVIINGIKLHKGCPEEVAELVIFLATCNDYINGVIIPIDGGKCIV